MSPGRFGAIAASGPARDSGGPCRKAGAERPPVCGPEIPAGGDRLITKSPLAVTFLEFLVDRTEPLDDFVEAFLNAPENGADKERDKKDTDEDDSLHGCFGGFTYRANGTRLKFFRLKVTRRSKLFDTSSGPGPRAAAGGDRPGPLAIVPYLRKG